MVVPKKRRECPEGAAALGLDPEPAGLPVIACSNFRSKWPYIKTDTSTTSGLYNLDRHIRMKRIDMVTKLDHELCLTRRSSWDMQNFQADPFPMVSRPSEANLV